MDRETLYLDNDEEITSVVDKLKGTEHVACDLVIPKEALLLQSVVNLKILKKQAESLGKEITIVTQDKVGKKLADQIGIAVISKPGEELKEVHMTEGEKEIIPADTTNIEMKEGKIEPKSVIEDDEIPIEMKPGSERIVTPTSEVITPVGSKIEPLVDELEIPSDKIKNPVTEKSKKKLKWKVIGITSGFVGLILLIVGYIFVPMANVTLTLAAEKQKVDFTFTADKNVENIENDTQTLPAREISEDVEKTEKYTATGKKKVGEKAKGTITVSDKGYTSKPNSTTLVSGTRFVSPSGLVFKTTTNVTVPGFEMVAGVVKAGTIDVSVEADQVGDSYNLPANTSFTIPALNTSNMSGKNSTAFTGGTSRDVTYVTQTDINTAKDEIKKVIEQESKRIILEKTERDERWLEGALKITEVSADSSVAVNGEASEFEIKAKSTVVALIFKDDDLKKIAESTLGDQIGSGKEIVESENLTSAAEFVSVDIDKGQMQGRLSGEAYIATKIDQDKMKIDLSGEPEGSALEYLNNLEGVESVELKHFPVFYKRMPRIEKHIYFKTTISKTQE